MVKDDAFQVVKVNINRRTKQRTIVLPVRLVKDKPDFVKFDSKKRRIFW